MRPLTKSETPFLARRVFTPDGILTLHLVTFNADGSVDARPCDGETPATIWTCSDVALLRRDALTDFLIDDIEMLKARKCESAEIYNYLKSSALLATSTSECCPIIL